MKKLPPITAIDIQEAFDHPNLKVFTDNKKLLVELEQKNWFQRNLLLMSSGTFNGLDFKEITERLEVKSEE